LGFISLYVDKKGGLPVVTHVSAIDYSALDRPDLLMFLFHPRAEEPTPRGRVEGFEELMIPVEPGVDVGARFFLSGPAAPNVLFFHGNGEIVADYDDIGRMMSESGINFLPVDYRGYGRSTGRPTVTTMMRDSHAVFDYVRRVVLEKGFHGPMVVMGRSLGSAPALELASGYPSQIDGLLIDSGFARMAPLLELFGFSMEALGISEEEGLRNLDKIRGFVKPTLIIHGERDELIPYSEGRALFEACGSPHKKLLGIREAGHNDLFLFGFDRYLGAVKELMETVRAERTAGAETDSGSPPGP
jgi:alpha-beta hydrolase superfamily lysophospholipase